MEVLYPNLQYALYIHDMVISKSGGLQGIKDKGQLESILEHIQNDLYYPTFEEKLTHLFFSITKFHIFNDGNKRSALSLGLFFLKINGFDYCTDRFVTEFENIVVWVAEGLISKQFLYKLICCTIYEEEYSEEMKLDLFRILNKNNK